MALNLRWRIAGAYVALIAALLLGLGLYLREAYRRDVRRASVARLADECGLVREVIGAAGDEKAVEATVRRMAAAGRMRITIIAPDGVVLADSQADAGSMSSHRARPEIDQAVREGLGVAIRGSTTVGQELLYVAQSVGPVEPIIRLAVPMGDVRRDWATRGRCITIAGLVAMLIATVLAVRLSASTTRAVADMARIARRLGEGDLTARAHEAAGGELSALAGALNSMARNLALSQEQQQRSTAHLRSILAQMSDGILVLSPDEVISVFNAAAGRLLGTHPEAALGRRLSEVAMDYEVQELARRTLRLQTPGQARLGSGRDTDQAVVAAATPVTSPGGELIGVVIALRDMAQIEHIQQVRQDFVANASHELRTPVAAIRALAETLSNGAIDDPEAAPGFLSQIVENTENLSRLLDDMLTLARYESVEAGAQRSLLSVSDAMARAAGRLGPQADAKKIGIDIRVPPHLQVFCREDNLMEALVNLIDNAVKYTPEGGRVSLAAEAINSHAQLTITDTGPGIPAAHRQRVFERFYRVDRARSRALGGTGLGLSIVKHAVEGEGGEVWVEEGPEGGARFCIVLPRTEDDQTA